MSILAGLSSDLIQMEIEHTELCGKGIYWKHEERPWDLYEFSKVHLPADLGPVHLAVPTWRLRILDCPVKMRDCTQFRIPLEASWCLPLIKKSAKVSGPQLSRYAYLTVDHSFVHAGKTQRHSGCHVDGFQGARIQKPLPTDHSFVWVDKWPTDFFKQGFPCQHLDPAYDDFFSYFDSVANELNVVRYEPYHLLWMNAYTVHRAGVATESSWRTFVRLAYSVREYDRLGNTYNPLFDYHWSMVRRDTPSGLRKFKKWNPEDEDVELSFLHR